MPTNLRGRTLFSLLVSLLVACSRPACAADTATSLQSPVLNALNEELTRSFTAMKNRHAEAPLYYLGYRLYDLRTRTLTASYGSLTQDTEKRNRFLSVDVRVGSPKLDNTHGSTGLFRLGRLYSGRSSTAAVPLDDDEAALRNVVWLNTDAALKAAEREYGQVKASKDIRVDEEDQSDDFAAAKPVDCINRINTAQPLDAELWKERLRRLSEIYKKYPDIQKSSVELVQETTTRYLINSEGTRIQDEVHQVRFTTKASSTMNDGMELNLYDLSHAFAADELPDEAALGQSIEAVAQDLMKLRKANVADPYAGPAILRGKAAAVFFHEILGHRVEGHRQKDEREGKTFTRKVNEQIMPEFISVFDDPTLKKIGQADLAGHYEIDDEGVPAQRVTVVENGVLRGFLMSRSPINKFTASNGHGRCSPGANPVARQGNLIVQSSKRVPYEKLREMLIEEARKQGKPYGLVFDEIAGGFAVTQTMFTQAFKLMPLKVTRVWADGRPDELIRGVNLVGTPIVSLETIISAGDDYATFNGICGAESGWVPVSASAPSLLVRTVEVARNDKSQTKPPLLPAPLYDKPTSKMGKGGEHK